MIEEALLQARELAHENRLEGKDLDELDELEDDEDEAFLDEYRKKRMDEIAHLTTSSVYNQVYPIQKPEYATEVTEESEKAFVLVLLTSSSGTNHESQRMIELWRQLATTFGDVKFCQMRADLCIEGYPDRNTPTVLIYRNKDIKKQIVTLKELRGEKTGIEDLEQVLLQLGAVKHGDKRLQGRSKADGERAGEMEKRRGIKQGGRKGMDEDEDSDWE